jgi:hypothetical protein
MPVKARSFAPPTSPRSKVKMLELRSQCASLRGTSTTTRALPSALSSMRRTRPIGKPAKVTSMPTTTPSESSACRYSVCVDSKAPRAYIRYSAAPATSTTISASSRAALNSALRTGAASLFWSVISVVVTHERCDFDEEDDGKQPHHVR